MEKKENNLIAEDSPAVRNGVWKRVKRWLIRLSREQSITGRLLKKMKRKYQYLRRYLFCVKQGFRPIQNNKIVFISHKGLQYSCNPMYLCEYLLAHYPGKLEIVWAFKNPEDFQYLRKKGIRLVKTESKEHLRDLMTARAIITNVDFYTYLPDRKGRVALDTWHGGGAYKTCGAYFEQNLTPKGKWRDLKKLYSKANLYCSSSTVFTQLVIRESRLFYGEVLPVGMPRNDMLVTGNRPDIQRKVRDYFHLSDETRIVLYAPTYRSAEELEQIPELDIGSLCHALHDRFGGDWVCLFRQHHMGGWDNQGALPATDYADMQELLYAADVLVSDYSSCIWDFSLMKKPTFLLCPDLDKYTSSRNFYFPIEQWPFILSHDNQELAEKIISFNEEQYLADIDSHHRFLGSCETGHATELICQRIAAECGIE